MVRILICDDCKAIHHLTIIRKHSRVDKGEISVPNKRTFKSHSTSEGSA